jgi:hypothetical protein
VGRREVLELVDEEVTAPCLEAPPQVPVGQEGLDRAVDLLVEVDRPQRSQSAPERIEGACEAGHVVARRLHLVGVAEAEAHGGEGLEVGRQTVSVGDGPPLRHEVLHDGSHLTLVEDPRATVAGEAQDLEGECVEGLDPGPDVGGPLQHLLLGPLVVGDGQDALSLVAAIRDEVAEPLGEDPRLAGSRRCDHAGGAAAVGHGGQLVRCEVGGRRGRLRLDVEVPEVDRLPVDDTEAGELLGGQRASGPAVDPDGPAVGEHAVARLVPVPASRRRPGPPSWTTTTSAPRRGRRRCWPRPGSGGGRATARRLRRGSTARP